MAEVTLGISGVGNSLPYWAFAMATASGFYGFMLWIGKHFSEQANAQLSSWLRGEYESTWTKQFGETFDKAFGKSHLSWNCFIRSSIASILAVLFVYFLSSHVLGVLGGRAIGHINLQKALFIGLLVNVIPDYLSLLQTRLLLKRFEYLVSPFKQLMVIILDIIVTCFISYASISIFLIVSGEFRVVSVVEILGLFSVYSIFFYSAFFTSIWAWIYCASTWLMKLFAKTNLKTILNVEKRPVDQIALVGASIILLSTYFAAPILQSGKDGAVTAFDDMLCSTFGGSVCFHTARATGNVEQAISFMQKACGDERYRNCSNQLEEFFAGDVENAVKVWKRLCDTGYTRACRAMGHYHLTGRSVNQDKKIAINLYEKACEQNDYKSCAALGQVFLEGNGVKLDLNKAKELYIKSCDGGFWRACTNIGWIYRNSDGDFLRNNKISTMYFQKGCDNDDNLSCFSLLLDSHNSKAKESDLNLYYSKLKNECENGDEFTCYNLGVANSQGLGVERNDETAFEYYRKSCKLGQFYGCRSLGYFYDEGGTMGNDFTQAASLYLQSCEGGDAAGCREIGWMFEYGSGVDLSPKKAAEFYKRACDGGDAQGCSNLGKMFDNGNGVKQSPEDAAAHYKMACDLGNSEGCNNFGWLLANRERGTASDDEASKLYAIACSDGNLRGCSNLGWLLVENGASGGVLYRAISLMELACANNLSFSCNDLGLVYEYNAYGLSYSDDPENLFTWSCFSGESLGCVNWLRYKVISQGVGYLITLTKSTFEYACSNGEQLACPRTTKQTKAVQPSN